MVIVVYSNTQHDIISYGFCKCMAPILINKDQWNLGLKQTPKPNDITFVMVYLCYNESGSRGGHDESFMDYMEQHKFVP